MKTAINDLIRQQLEKYHCVKGRLRYQPPSVLSLNGIRADEKPVLIWLSGPQLGFQLSQYVGKEPTWGGLTIDIDLEEGRFEYHPLFVNDMKREAAQQQREREEEQRQELQTTRQTLERRTQPYGTELAEQVAIRLKESSIGYGHRDYCGMGLELSNDTYRYGELWDGIMNEPDLYWDNKKSFVDWLARQSDASLSRLESKDPFYWGNQVINEERLREFVQ